MSYIQNYELLSRLGEGHFGEVYAAVGEVPGRGLSAGRRRLVALKTLKEGADAHSKDLLIQEFGLLDQVKHRCIVRVFEFIPADDAVVMEYIHGVTLRKMLDELSAAREQVFTEAAIELCCEIADALYQAWTTPGDNGEPLRLVHRDLKPENIMLTPNGDVKILDFGLAHVDNADFAKEDPDRLKGTPIYMAPEQARGQHIDHRTDLFALGLIAYELLMNQAAYRVPASSTDPLGDVFDAIERGALLEQCRELEAKLPGVGPVLTRLLQPNPRSRYPDGQALLVDLRRQLYRDRGAYLKEFCEFFFGAIYEMPAPPNPESGAGVSAPPRRAGGGAGAGRSFEDRVRASMAKNQDRAGRAETFNPTASKAAVQRARPRADNLAGGPQRPQVRRPGGRPAAGSPAPVRAPQPGGGGKTPPPRRGLEPIKSRKVVGARSPDETGMLQMVDLSDVVGEEEEPSSATAFFAIPAPKTKSRDQRAAPAPASSAPVLPPQQHTPAAPPAFGGPSHPPPGAPPAFGGAAYPPPGAPMGGIQGPMGAPPGAAHRAAPAPLAGIQGPTSAPPGGHVHAAPPPPAHDPGRTSSNRVYAVFLVLFLLVGGSTAGAVWYLSQDKGEDVPPVQRAELTPERETTKAEVREEQKVEDEEKLILDHEQNTNQTYVPPTGYVPPANTAPPPPPKPVGDGPLTVAFSGAEANGVTVSCPSGFSDRAGFSGGIATFAKVPDDACTLTFRGAMGGSWGPVKGNMSVSCTYSGGVYSCG